MEIKKDLLRKKMKNIEFSKVVSLKDEVTYREGEVVSKTLAQNNYVSITLFAFGDGDVCLSSSIFIANSRSHTAPKRVSLVDVPSSTMVMGLR